MSKCNGEFSSMIFAIISITLLLCYAIYDYDNRENQMNENLFMKKLNVHINEKQSFFSDFNMKYKIIADKGIFFTDEINFYNIEKGENYTFYTYCSIIDGEEIKCVKYEDGIEEYSYYNYYLDKYEVIPNE